MAIWAGHVLNYEKQSFNSRKSSPLNKLKAGVDVLLTSITKFTHKATLPSVFRILILVALPLAVFSSGSAASLQGKVSEVVDGESIAILSQTHTLKVKLIGVAAPEQNQAYAGMARQHLADLVLNKFVMVHYSALRDGYLVGQVVLGDMDVSAQMLRDGVGWYKQHEGNLSEVERQIYEASQAAARSERRGLWQDESPIAPWDFRKPPIVTPLASTLSLPGQSKSVRRSDRSGLSSEDLMSSGVPTGLMAGSTGARPDVRQLSPDGAQGRWLRYQPADRHFSILVPSDGIEVSYKVLAAQGQLTDVHYVVGLNVSSKTIYLLSWAKGPNSISTDDSALADAVKGFLTEVNRVRERYGEVLVTATPGRSLILAGYQGKEYAMATGSASGVIRVLTKQIGTEREVFLLGRLTTPGTTSSADEFLNSFKISQN
jgi:endonuclease YncB( thermonuclease family)